MPSNLAHPAASKKRTVVVREMARIGAFLASDPPADLAVWPLTRPLSEFFTWHASCRRISQDARAAFASRVRDLMVEAEALAKMHAFALLAEVEAKLHMITFVEVNSKWQRT